ncbi:MAG: hypothetical protein V8Q89_00150 [Christensenellales bacterium]
MSEKPNPPKKDIYSYLALLLCFALFVAGVCGIVSSRTASHEYKNSDDVREVSAVVQDYEPIAIKDSDGNTTDWKYEAKLSFDVEGKTYTGKDTFYRDISSGKRSRSRSIEPERASISSLRKAILWISFCTVWLLLSAVF